MFTGEVAPAPLQQIYHVRRTDGRTSRYPAVAPVNHVAPLCAGDHRRRGWRNWSCKAWQCQRVVEVTRCQHCNVPMTGLGELKGVIEDTPDEDIRGSCGKAVGCGAVQRRLHNAHATSESAWKRPGRLQCVE